MRVPLDATPLGGHRLTSGPSTATTRAPSVSGVSGRVLVARRASPNVGARTCSICARVALRRVVPCAAPEALGGPWRPWSPGMRLLCTPSGGGRSTGCTATAHTHEDPAPGAELPREAFTAPLRAPRGAPRGRTKTTNPQARMVRARGARREGAGHSYGPWLSPTPTKISRRARHHGKHLLRAPHGAPGRVHQTPLRPWVRV